MSETIFPLFLTVGVFLFPDDYIKQRKINDFFISGNLPEINRILIEFVNNLDSIVRRFNSTATHYERGEVHNSINLMDVFNVVNHDSYPILWETTMRALTILPITVSCEQNFSRLRHKLHENMSKETSFAFLRISQKRNYYLFDNENTMPNNP